MAELRRIPGGFFAAFEGGEHTGKTTQAKMAAESLRQAGWDVELTREPGATHIGSQVRALLLDPANEDLEPAAEALLYAADRAQHVSQVIRPAMARGAVVITDRYADSSAAYQGAGRDLSVSSVEALSDWATGGLKPDLTVLLDMHPLEARRRREGKADRIEREPLAFHETVRRTFLQLALAEPCRYLIVSASAGPDEVHGEVMSRIEDQMKDFTENAAYDGSSSKTPPAAFESTGGSQA